MKRLLLVLVSVCAAVLYLAAPALACPHARHVVSTAWLSRHLDDPDLVLVDIRSNEEYLGGHIRRSVNVPFAVPFSTWITMRDDLLFEVPDDADLFAALGAAGIDASSTVVVVGTTSAEGVPPSYPLSQTARVVTTLLYAGVRDARVLDGGINQWVAESRNLSSEALLPEPVEFDGRTRAGMFVSKDYVESRIGHPGTVILDTRDADVYYGNVIESFAPRAGHIPTAKSLPAPLIWNDDGTYKSPFELWKLATDVLGVIPPREIIVYCGVGGYASGWWFALRHLLGYRNVKFYDGSAQEWAADPDAPMVAFTWE